MTQNSSTPPQKKKPAKKRDPLASQRVNFEDKDGPELSKRHGYEDIGNGCYRRRTTSRD